MKHWNGTRNQEGQRVFFANELTVFKVGKEYTHADDDGTRSFRILKELETHKYLCQFTDTDEVFELVNDPWK